MTLTRRKKALLVLPLIVIVGGLIIYANNFKNEKSESFTEVYSELDIFTLNNYTNYSAVTEDFNLGKKTFADSIEIELKGLISYPKEVENAPILIILSGNENVANTVNSSSKNLYKGYKYLAENLAKSGYLTLVIDTQFKDNDFDAGDIVEDKILEELFDFHIDNLKKSIEGTNIYDINLFQKGDIKNIGLIGQSSTALNIFNICNKKYDTNETYIKGLLSITPGESLAVSTEYPDVPTGILVAEHSVNTKIGFDIYNEMEKDINRNSVATLTYLIGGDSSQFNERIEEDKIVEAKVEESIKVIEEKTDSEEKTDLEENVIANETSSLSRMSDENLAGAVESAITEENILKNENTDLVEDRELHENFLSSYAVEFFNSIFEKESSFTDIFAGLVSSPTKMYGMNVLNKYTGFMDKESIVSSYSIYSSDNETNIKKKGITITDVIESDVVEVDTALNFNEPTTTMSLKLKRVDWEQKGAYISIPLKKIDVEDYNTLSIRWAINSSSNLNLISQKAVTLTLEDKFGRTSNVVLTLENAMKKIEGREKELENGTTDWSRYTPLSDTRISLKEFKDIDLDNVKNITISFDAHDSGSIYIEDISLLKNEKSIALNYVD